MRPPRQGGKIIGCAPILLVRDVRAAADYYRDKLGFQYERFFGDPPAVCMPRRDSHIVMLSQTSDARFVVPNYKAVEKMWDIYFWVEDAEAMYQELRARGATMDYDLCVQPYGAREFGVQDLDGYDIAFGQDLDGA